MDDFHKVLKKNFSISNEKANLVKEISDLRVNQLSLTKEKELLEKGKQIFKFGTFSLERKGLQNE